MKLPRQPLPSKRSGRRSNKEQYWRLHIQECEASGQGVRAYCREKGIEEKSLYFWRRKMARGAEPGNQKRDAGSENSPAPIVATTQAPPFVQLNLVPEETDHGVAARKILPAESPLGLKITMPNGYSICLSRVSDIEQLGAVLEILEEKRC